MTMTHRVKSKFVTIDEFLDLNNFDEQFIHFFNLPNGITITLGRFENSFGYELGLFESTISGDDKNKFFEHIFGWLSIDDFKFLLHQASIVHTDEFYISEEWYGKHLPSEEQIIESNLELERALERGDMQC